MPLTTDSFNGDVFTPEVVKSVINLGLQSAPVFNSLTRKPTARGSVVFPTADPDGAGWVNELDLIPTVSINDDSKIVVPGKIGGIVMLSNESIADADLNVGNEIGRLVGESLASKADVDLTYGTGVAPVPTGFHAALPEATGADLRKAVVAAAQAIMANGGTPTTVILAPDLWASEVNRRETVHAGHGLLDDLGIPLSTVVANTLQAGDAIVLDKAGCFGVVRSDYSIAMDTGGDAFARDAVALRVLARLAVAIPAPLKHARRLTVA